MEDPGAILGAAWDGGVDGFQQTIDTAIPFYDPLSDYYDPNAPGMQAGKYAANIGVSAAYMAIPVGSLSAGVRSVFYSGGKPALDAARLSNGILLESTIGGRVLNYIHGSKLIPFNVPDVGWRAASAIYALNAKGQALVYIRGVPRANAIWKTTEKPLLNFMNTKYIFK